MEEGRKMKKLACPHYLCIKCFLDVKEKIGSCPLCREPIIDNDEKEKLRIMNRLIFKSGKRISSKDATDEDVLEWFNEIRAEIKKREEEMAEKIELNRIKKLERIENMEFENAKRFKLLTDNDIHIT